VNASLFGDTELVGGEFDDETHGGVCVVLAVVGDDAWFVVLAVEHCLEDGLFVGLGPHADWQLCRKEERS